MWLPLKLIEIAYGAPTAATVPGNSAGVAQFVPLDIQDFLTKFYNYALMIAGLLAFAMIVWGGVEYAISAGNSSRQNDAKDRIKEALLGLVLLLGVFVILNTINPEIVNLKLQPLAPVKPAVSLPPGTNVPGDLTTDTAKSSLEANGIIIAGPITLDGLRQTTVDELIRLKSDCNCEVVVTSGTGGEHKVGSCSHANGYKVDLRSSGGTNTLSRYIIANYPKLPGKRSDGADLYRAPSGAIYANETTQGSAPHWDVVVGCP